MNIKDYLHLYLGARVRVKRKIDTKYHIGRICEVTKSSNHGDWIQVWFDDVITVTSRTFETSSSNCHSFFISEDFIELVLRPLKDMNDEEKVRVFLWEYSNYKSGELIKNNSDKDFFIVKNENGMKCYVNQHHFSAETTRKLLKAGFDLFGLIEAGLAIDATTLPNANRNQPNK